MDDITKKILKFEKIKDYLEEESLILAEEVINNRLRQKKILGEKINILFICHRPTVWNSLKTVYQAFKEDDSFNVSVLAIPNKKQLPDLGLSHKNFGMITGVFKDTIMIQKNGEILENFDRIMFSFSNPIILKDQENIKVG